MARGMQTSPGQDCICNKSMAFDPCQMKKQTKKNKKDNERIDVAALEFVSGLTRLLFSVQSGLVFKPGRFFNLCLIQYI